MTDKELFEYLDAQGYGELPSQYADAIEDVIAESDEKLDPKDLLRAVALTVLQRVEYNATIFDEE